MLQEATVVIPDANEDKIKKCDARTTSLRRACTALLFFSVLCSRPWPSAGWLGMLASVSVLCAAPNSLLCRARVARFLAGLTVIFAGITLVHLIVAIHAGEPQQIGEEISAQCVGMPADTFEWARAIISKHECTRKGLTFLSRHMSISAEPQEDADGMALLNATDPAPLRMALPNATDLSTIVSTELEWSQQEACVMISRIATCVIKMMMVGSALAHLFLFLSAAAVVKRACCLRLVAYQCGLPKMNKCGARKCKYASKPADAATSLNNKELA